jgi:hypothetical protein
MMLRQIWEDLAAGVVLLKSMWNDRCFSPYDSLTLSKVELALDVPFRQVDDASVVEFVDVLPDTFDTECSLSKSMHLLLVVSGSLVVTAPHCSGQIHIPYLGIPPVWAS